MPKLATLLSPPDPRDKQFADFDWPAVAAGDYDVPEYTEISNQGPIGTCVSNAVADGLEVVCGVRTPTEVQQVSRLDLHWKSRATHNATHLDEGTYIRAAIQQAHAVGVCAESIWPYIPEKWNVAPPIEATIRSSENKITGYYAITSIGMKRVLAVADALYANCPVVYATGVEEAFGGVRQHTDAIKPPAKIAGYHAMLIVGVRIVNGRYKFRVRNSWGKGWGNAGYWWMDQDYLTWDYTNDIWVLTYMEPLL